MRKKAKKTKKKCAKILTSDEYLIGKLKEEKPEEEPWWTKTTIGALAGSRTMYKG